MPIPNQLKKWWPEILLIATISALIYLAQVDTLSYVRDDWYYAYDGYVAGSSIFNVMFSSDRPARGPFFEIYYLLFGPAPFPYHIGIYIWKLLGGCAALWLFHILWQRQRITNFFAAMLFVVYPGFLWWPEAIEYQPMVASASLQTFSIALTLLALNSSTHKISRLIFWITSASTGLYAILLVDYAIGMEAFRIFCIFFVIHHEQGNKFSFVQKITTTVRASLIPLSIPLAFIVWKIFFFTGDRKATDIGVQISTFAEKPWETAGVWGHNFLSSFLNVCFYSWWVPLREYYRLLHPNDLPIGFLIVLIVIGLVFCIHQILQKQSLDKKIPDEWVADREWKPSAIWLGLGGVVFGLVPVIMANRFVAFQAYSHYALPASLPVAILVTGLIYLSSSRRIQLGLILLLIGISTLTHYSLVINTNREKENIRNFWWQVYWRTPMITRGTTLAVDYPDIHYDDDTAVVWGPANFLYYPEQRIGTTLVRYPLAGTMLDEAGIEDIAGATKKISSSYRSHTMFLNYRQVLIMSQPSRTSCVHVIDQNWPEISISDSPELSSLFPYSKIEQVETAPETSLVPLDFIFGSEPAHTWCFYYQKAELARQQGDWEKVTSLEKEASDLQLSPNDLVEWMPFVQAYAYLDQKDKVSELFFKIKDHSFLRQQFCENLNRMNTMDFALQPEMQDLINTSFCKN